MQAIVDYSALSIPQLAQKVGFKTPQTIREILKGNTKTLSEAVCYKIISSYPQIDEHWLRTGDGEMLRSGVVSQSPTGDNSPNVNGSGNANGGVRDMGGMIELQKGYQEMLRKSQSQIDRLLGIIERMQGGEGKE